MKKLLFSFITILFISACSLVSQQEPEMHQSDLPKSVEVVHYDFVGTYVTEDLQDGIEIYDNFSFAYKPDCNN